MSKQNQRRAKNGQFSGGGSKKLGFGSSNVAKAAWLAAHKENVARNKKRAGG